MADKPKTYPHKALRHKKTKHISSTHDQQNLASLRYALETIEADPNRNHGILEALWPKIDAERPRIMRSMDYYDLVEVEGRVRDNGNAQLGEILCALVALFLRGKENEPARKMSSIKFYEWLQAEIHKPTPKGKAPSAVKLLTDKDCLVRYMGARQIKDAYLLIRKLQS